MTGPKLSLSADLWAIRKAWPSLVASVVAAFVGAWSHSWLGALVIVPALMAVLIGGAVCFALGQVDEKRRTISRLTKAADVR